MSLVGKKGVDISSLNGNVDINKIKNAGYDFVMIRCGYGSDIQSQDDTQFENNVKKCEAAGLPWGAYLYSYAINVSSANSEVQHILRLLKGKKPTMPIAIDIEDADGYHERNGGWNYNTINTVTKIILDGIRKAGYYPMLYTGFEELENLISKEVANGVDLWFAQWWKTCDYKGNNLGMWQYGGETNYLDSPTISGVGVVDQDKCYKDYPTIIKNGGYNNWSKQTTPTTITEEQLRQKVANTINSWLGAVEGDSTHAKILKIYNSQKNLPYGYKMETHDAWCAATVSAAWIEVGIADYICTDCNCGGFRDKAIELGIWVENDAYKPKIGDAIIYNWSDSGVGDNKGSADHIGLVTAVNGNNFTVTEGNTKNSSGQNVVGKRTMEVDGKYIRGFIAPKYGEIAKKVSGKISPDEPAAKVEEPSIFVQVVSNGKWQKVIKNGVTPAGVEGKPIVAFAVKVTKGNVEYSAHLNGGNWLGNITGWNYKDYNNGYAGIGNPAEKGKAIDMVKINYKTPQDVINEYGYYKVAYRVHLLGANKNDWLDWQYDIETYDGQDGYAGIYGKPIDLIEVKLIKA